MGFDGKVERNAINKISIDSKNCGMNSLSICSGPVEWQHPLLACASCG